ncbi:mechanosensitive ion channel family protein [Anatilimnocola floriformis]|uniref:mechanosensitive ion channel family protein n=1 Tax=Anatilimnocola floriformis TaxID=2948575 RepID=UPI0020C46240|nr:mechanosensitive ion channel family protein [Anatilimnocola floriformis]
MPINWEKLRADLELPFYGNTLRQWAIAIGTALAVFIIAKLVQAVLVSRLRKLNEKLPSDAGASFVEGLASVRLWLLLIVAVFIASLALALPPKTTAILNTVAAVAVLLQAALTGNAIISLLVKGYSLKNLATDAASVTTVTTVGFLGRLALWTIIALLVLQNLGVDVSALVTGLGIGGIAVALAAQNVLGDLFASLSIMLDKPFVLGDFIIVGDQMGTVEKIGIKTTHLRSLSGEQLIISNADLLKSRIRNCKRMQERRIVFTIGVSYQTPGDKLASVSKLLREAVETQSNIRFDRAHFKGFAASSLEFEAVYFVLTPDYNLYMDIQQAINLWLFEKFGEAGIKFASPQPTTVNIQATDLTAKGEEKAGS